MKTKPSIALYHMPTCPYCVRVFDWLKKHKRTIELRDVDAREAHARELVDQGGKDQVPCLRIEEGGKVRWLYESLDIIAWLQQHPRS
jgi:glutaredoxin